MNYRQAGTSSLQLSRIGFGCMSMKPGNSSNERIIHHALDLGINYFDTADLYDQGANENLLGKALKTKRQQAIIATKVGNQWKKDGSGWEWNPRKDHILEAVNQSLRRLDTDYIDLYQLHGGTLDDPMAETIGAFELLVKQGKIRHYGISSIRPNLIREWSALSRLSTVMMQYSLLDRRPEESCLDLLRKNNIGMLARGSLAQGLLAGKTSRHYLGHPEQDVDKAARAVLELSQEGRTAAQTAIRFVLHHPAVTSAVVGISTHEQLEEAAATFSSPDLTEAEWQHLQQSVPPRHYTDHR